MAEYRLYNGKEVTKEEIEKAVNEERALIVYEDGDGGKLVFYKDYNEALAVWDSEAWTKWPSVEGALLIAGRSTVVVTILVNGQRVEVEDGDSLWVNSVECPYGSGVTDWIEIERRGEIIFRG
ncbi:MAG: hypothetical protein SVY53_05220 [Chloroflexota bacterium]|nr:hypothetical protein [Chloroflexota bacterium]